MLYYVVNMSATTGGSGHIFTSSENVTVSWQGCADIVGDSFYHTFDMAEFDCILNHSRLKSVFMHVFRSKNSLKLRMESLFGTSL